MASNSVHGSMSDEQRQLLPRITDALREELTAHSSFAASTINFYADKVSRQDGDYKTLARIFRALFYLQNPASVSFNADHAATPDLDSVIEMWQESDRQAESTNAKACIIKRDNIILRDLQVLQQRSANKAQGCQQRYLTIPTQYLPCTVSLESLVHTKLSDLKLNSHNRGKYVSVRRIGSLIHQQTRTLATVADQAGDAIFLEVLAVGDSLNHAAVMTGTTLAIKEPYVITGRDVPCCIHVDHPTDVVWLREDAGPRKSWSATSWKDRGNDLFKAGSFTDAVVAYEQGLKTVFDHTTERDLHRNLAQACLALGFWDLAKAHSSAALDLRAHSPASSRRDIPNGDLSLVGLSLAKSRTSDAKAHFRAAIAAYHLHDFDSAKLELQGVLKLVPQDVDGKRELLRVYRRLQEQEQGAYDFDDILSKSTAKQPNLDVASFTRRTIVQSSSSKGNGLFAAEDLDIGDLVLCEKAFYAHFHLDPKSEVVRTYDGHTEIFSAISATLWLQILQEITKNSSRAAGVMSLGGFYEGLGGEKIIADGKQVIDAFQLHDIVTRNAFGIPNPLGSEVGSQNFGVYRLQLTVLGQQSKPQNTALFCQAALINHSCLPNVEKRFIGDLIIIRASRRIKKGEEILLDYAPELYKDTRERESAFKRTWQFSCDCRLCAAEAQEDHVILDHRLKLIDEANRLGCEISQNLPVPNVSSGEVSRLEQTISELRDTYDSRFYEGLPCKGSAYALTSLALTYGTKKDYWKYVATIKDAFGSMGWQSPLETGGRLVPKAGHTTFLDLNMPQLLYIASSAAANAGQLEVAETIKQIEPQVYAALNGTMNGFKSIDERRRG